VPAKRAVLVAACLATPVLAQDLATNRVAGEGDWSVFVEQNPGECIAVSRAVDELNLRDGQPVSVQRGDSLLYVIWRPGEGVAGQVVFTGGYPFAPGSAVALVIGDRRFNLFTEGDHAWSENAAADADIIAAMRAGSQAILAGVSGRGTQTQDTFSLSGFTAMSGAASQACGG
jgi:Invasion associated locus B (IalB) protein